MRTSQALALLVCLSAASAVIGLRFGDNDTCEAHVGEDETLGLVQLKLKTKLKTKLAASSPDGGALFQKPLQLLLQPSSEPSENCIDAIKANGKCFNKVRDCLLGKGDAGAEACRKIEKDFPPSECRTPEIDQACGPGDGEGALFQKPLQLLLQPSWEPSENCIDAIKANGKCFNKVRDCLLGKGDAGAEACRKIEKDFPPTECRTPEIDQACGPGDGPDGGVLFQKSISSWIHRRRSGNGPDGGPSPGDPRIHRRRRMERRRYTPWR